MFDLFSLFLKPDLRFIGRFHRDLPIKQLLKDLLLRYKGVPLIEIRLLNSFGDFYIFNLHLIGMWAIHFFTKCYIFFICFSGNLRKLAKRKLIIEIITE
jgi:hypothetical protein